MKKGDLVVGGWSIDPRPGDFVRHYKGGFYYVLAIALDEETMAKRVIYVEVIRVGSKKPRIFDRAMEAWVSQARPKGSTRHVPRYITIVWQDSTPRKRARK